MSLENPTLELLRVDWADQVPAPATSAPDDLDIPIVDAVEIDDDELPHWGEVHASDWGTDNRFTVA